MGRDQLMALVSKAVHLANGQTRHRHPKSTLPLHTPPSCWGITSKLARAVFSAQLLPGLSAQVGSIALSPSCYDRDTFPHSSDQTYHPSTQPAQIEQAHRSVSWITSRLFNPESKTTSLLNSLIFSSTFGQKGSQTVSVFENSCVNLNQSTLLCFY